MPLDLSRVGQRDSKPLRPRDIYNASRRPWPYLRFEQGEVLDKWFQEDVRNRRDVVIKQNTGGGKTAVGLLIAQSTLNEGIGAAVYLAPDRYLASQARAEAAKIGLPVTDDASDVKFRNGRATLVTTFQKLVNGQSVFGVVGDQRDKRKLGLVVVDDAHAALATTESQFRLTVESTHPVYWPLVELFENDLEEQSPNRWADVRTGDYTAVVPVPFWAWARRQRDVMDLLHPYAQTGAFKFTWPLIADVLGICSVTVTSRSVEISPPCPPISMIPAFANASRRVYLTATLADDSVLVTDLDANPEDVARPVTPGSAADLGDRMILAPSALNPGLDDEAVRQLARQFADGDRDGDGIYEARPVNVVVLVPRDKAMDAWTGYADLVLNASNLDQGITALKAGHVGLVVLSNKYDGIDLPSTACELLVLDGAPRAMDATERREAAVLSGSPTLFARQIQRIEQGMGRGVRDSEDHCAVLLVGSHLAVALHDRTHLDLFSPATRAQINLSQDLTDELAGKGLDAIREALSLCLDKDDTWVSIGRRGLAEIQYATTGSVRPEAVAARSAFDLAATHRYSEACDRLQEVLGQVTDPAMRGLLAEQRAAYLHHFEPNAAQNALRKALDDNPHVLRPLGGVAAAQLRPAAAQAEAAAAFLSRTYPDATSLLLGVKSIFEDVVWGDEKRSKDAERAVEQLGLHLGFASSRPEDMYGKGPDDLWALSSDRHAVIELKTGRTHDAIIKHDLDQLGGAVRWNAETHPGVTQIPVIMHPSPVLHGQGTAVTGMRVITPQTWNRLSEAVRAFAEALTNGQQRWREHHAVAEQLAQHKLTATTLFTTYTEPHQRASTA
ncbi:DEAD/DEAH box helicase [Actinacidiphila oryziradicis]|uniref:DEAD/DEAH box helicase n=1 Tax=Actinacidiphila oryziradicis TaxID=2571141 RepID=A0A4U0SPR6_9ACTN|nr:DEAD/DEAH box helicase [Actinacidiphila oryziradicis]TKA12060.1 DEAD/DEAH box helicase [Actinacidiphila oryziradicis]